jgi:hypothetical protein
MLDTGERFVHGFDSKSAEAARATAARQCFVVLTCGLSVCLASRPLETDGGNAARRPNLPYPVQRFLVIRGPMNGTYFYPTSVGSLSEDPDQWEPLDKLARGQRD